LPASAFNKADLIKLCKKTGTTKTQFHVIDPPVLWCTTRHPARCDDSSAPSQLDVRTHYRLQYFATVDTAVNCIEERIKQTGLQLHVSTEQLLLDAAYEQASDERLSCVCDFFRKISIENA